MDRDIRVIVGDDSADDRYLFGRAFRKTCAQVTVEFACNGEEVIKLLENSSRAMPSLLIVDSMMTRKNGFDVVTWLRAKKEFEQLPVVMISGQLSERNAARAKDVGANVYIAKPDDLDGLEKLIRRLAQKYLQPAL